MQIRNYYDLSRLNTLHLKSLARYFATVHHTYELAEFFKDVEYGRLDFIVLGGGSNLILPEIYPGLVIHNQLFGIHKINEDNNTVLVRAMAGENWDDFVDYTLKQGWYGLENLSLIPGTVGASPIQNIGAYGVEAKDFIEQVEVYDTKHKNPLIVTNSGCGFEYRNSRFKRDKHFIVTSVVFRLNKIPTLNLTYGDLHKKMMQVPMPTPLDVRNCVIETRQSKLPDPKIVANVGSFFHNPILENTQVTELAKRYPDLPIYKIDTERSKVSAGWLIDNLGLKGHCIGSAGVYEKQALVLVNHGGSSAKDILKLAKFIQDQVYKHYTINLTIEPIIV